MPLAIADNKQKFIKNSLSEEEIDATWKVMGMTAEFLTNLPATIQKNLVTGLARQGCSFEDSKGENMMNEILELSYKIAERIQAIEWIPDLFGHKIHKRIEEIKYILKKAVPEPLKLLKTILIPVNAKALEMIERTCSFPDYLSVINYGEGTITRDIEEFLGMISHNVPYQVMKVMEKRVNDIKKKKWNAFVEIKKIIEETEFGKTINTYGIPKQTKRKPEKELGEALFSSQVQLQDTLEIEFLEAAAGREDADEIAKKCLLYVMGEMALMYNGLSAQLPRSFSDKNIEKYFGKNYTEQVIKILEVFIRCLAGIEQLKRMERYLP